MLILVQIYIFGYRYNLVAVVALKDLSPFNDREMLLYINEDLMKIATRRQWRRSPMLPLPNSEKTLGLTTHSLAVDVAL